MAAAYVIGPPGWESSPHDSVDAATSHAENLATLNAGVIFTVARPVVYISASTTDLTFDYA